MPKRSLEDGDDRSAPSKRIKRDLSINGLSDELLLRTLSFLSVPSLCRCQRVSRRFSAIAGDSQIWKQLYYNRFVRPRAARLPSLKDSAIADSSLYFSSKVSRWLDEDNLVRRGKATNWKRQYKLRDNWARGKCAVKEIDVAEEPPMPKMLVRLHEGILFTVHRSGGLRAWSAKNERHLLAETTLKHDRANGAPTSLAIDANMHDKEAAHLARLAVGFADGSFAVYAFDRDKHEFQSLCKHPSSTNGMLSAVAYASPYLLTMTSKQLLSLYSCPLDLQKDPPRLLHSLKSQIIRPPLSLCVRQSGDSIIASIAYITPMIMHGWRAGVQEIKLSASGDIIESRLATAWGDVQPLGQRLPLSRSPPRASYGSTATGDMHESVATSISYSHPYLLMSHSDNTLTLHLVKSTASTLAIGEGSRLWGHTSSVSGAHVGGRGKAVSVSSHGDELRVWELEGALSSLTMRRRLSTGQLSVRVQTEQKSQEDNEGFTALSNAIARRGSGLGLALRETRHEAEVMKGWVGFDEETAVVLKQRPDGRQALVVYDFT